MTISRRLRPFALVALAAIVTLVPSPPAPAFAESQDLDQITLGAMTESGDVVAVLSGAESRDAVSDSTDPTAPRVFAFRIAEPMRGAQLDDVVLVALTPGVAATIAPGGRYLAFLRRTAGDRFVPVSVPYGLRAMAESGVKPLYDYARAYALCFDASGALAKPDEFAELLVSSLGSTESGVPFCAGRDLIRHDDVWTRVTPAMRERVTAALRVPRKADDDLASIILAAGPLGGDGTDAALIARLLDPATRTMRRHVSRALSVRASAPLVASLAAKLDSASDDQRADIANALGAVALRECEAPLVPLLRHENVAVRVEAAHALGLVARAVREPKAGVDPSLPRPKLDTSLTPIVEAVDRATTENERRATLWALAQIDVPDAWAALRKMAKEHPELRVRELAARYLAAPRVALLLE